jgi:hypothetical protein
MLSNLDEIDAIPRVYTHCVRTCTLQCATVELMTRLHCTYRTIIVTESMHMCFVCLHGNRCISTGNEVLQRINAVPDRYFFDPNNTWHTANGSDFSELTGVNPIDPTVVHTLGSLKLESLEIATVSFYTTCIRLAVMQLRITVCLFMCCVVIWFELAPDALNGAAQHIAIFVMSR